MIVHYGFCYINDLKVPYPDVGSGTQSIATMVDSGRNARGVVVGEKIGRDVAKVEMSWSVLPPDVWSSILKELDKSFFFNFKYLDMVTNKMVTRKFYCGDRSATPYLINRQTNKPKYYRNCTVNVIDMGL